MKNLQEYLCEEKQTNGRGCIEMIQTIIDQLKIDHPDCRYNKETKKWEGKDADLWKGAGQFVYDYMQDLNQNDFNKLIKFFNWEKWIPNMNDINPADISVCMALELTLN